MPPLQVDCDMTVTLLALSSRLRNHAIEMDKRRRVTFDGTVSTKVVSKIPTQYYNNVWMEKDDYVRIRRACAGDIVHALLDGIDSSDVEYCIRGLETNMSDQNFVRSYEWRKESIMTVLEEQKFQRQTGYSCPEDIAAAYKEVAAPSIAHAVVMAEQDEVAAREAANTNTI